MYRLEITNFDIKKIADSGQIFRFDEIKDGYFELIAKDKLLYIKEISIGEAKNIYEFECSKEEFVDFWENYFDINTDYDYFIEKIDKNDEFLQNAISYAKGIRILKQDKFEMLISFIISQRKSIPAIKSAIKKLSERFGKCIVKDKYAFPTLEELSKASIKDLEECSLGYRASYILETCKYLTENPTFLDDISNLSDKELVASLCKLKGVGIKVANCTALFGYYKIDSFPIDVWIQKVLDKYYSKGFPYERYDGFAGVIQQYMFYYGRNADKK